MNNSVWRWYQSRVRQLEKRIAEQDLLLAQWESIDELNRERSQQRLQRIAELEELLAECYKAIESLPKDALGTGYVSGTGEQYPLRDELLHNMAKELSDGF